MLMKYQKVLQYLLNQQILSPIHRGSLLCRFIVVKLLGSLNTSFPQKAKSSSTTCFPWGFSVSIRDPVEEGIWLHVILILFLWQLWLLFLVWFPTHAHWFSLFSYHSLALLYLFNFLLTRIVIEQSTPSFYSASSRQIKYILSNRHRFGVQIDLCSMSSFTKQGGHENLKEGK